MYNVPMMKKQIKILKDDVETKLLDFVRMPGRYIGAEVNQVQKDLAACDLTIALCFPDIYEVAMSNSGIQIIYHVLNSMENVAAERVFSPWTDAEEVMRQKNLPLFSLESKANVADFDVIAFSLGNELCYTNVLNVLDLAGIPVRTANRTDDHPLIIAGGAMSNGCEPIAPFIDVFIIGEGEETSVELAKLLIELKKQNTPKAEVLKIIDKKFDWAYVPSLYSFEYDGDKIKSFSSIRKFKNAVVEDFENAPVPEKPIVPYIDTIHERICIEIMRGCPGRCRFCQASFTRRPLRFRSVEKIFDIAKKNYDATGFDTISLLSLSTADYPELEKLLETMFGYFKQRQVGVSLPSLRVDQQLQLLPKFVSNVRKSGLTIAVEAAPERIRKMMNKPLTNENLFAGVDAAYRSGWSKLKLYFMAGFPGETEDDIRQIVDLSLELANMRRKIAKRPGELNVAISWLVPKNHTPLGWLGQKPKEYFENAKKIILDRKRELRANALQFKFHTIDRSVLESAMGRGDRRLADVIETAWRNGAKFDLWDECFDIKIWQDAFNKHNIDLDKCAQKTYAVDEILPWQHLGGPATDYLLSHYEDAMSLA